MLRSKFVQCVQDKEQFLAALNHSVQQLLKLFLTRLGPLPFVDPVEVFNQGPQVRVALDDLLHEALEDIANSQGLAVSKIDVGDADGTAGRFLTTNEIVNYNGSVRCKPRSRPNYV